MIPSITDLADVRIVVGPVVLSIRASMTIFRKKGSSSFVVIYSSKAEEAIERANGTTYSLGSVAFNKIAPMRIVLRGDRGLVTLLTMWLIYCLMLLSNSSVSHIWLYVARH